MPNKIEQHQINFIYYNTSYNNSTTSNELERYLCFLKDTISSSYHMFLSELKLKETISYLYLLFR